MKSPCRSCWPLFTLVFLIVTATLWPMAYNVELYMKDYLGLERAAYQPGHRRAHPGRPPGVPDSHDDRRAPGRHRHRGDGPGAAGPTSSPRAERPWKWPATWTPCSWTRRARSPWATAEPPSSSPSMDSPPSRSDDLAAQASAADETPEGKSIVELFHKFDGPRDGNRQVGPVDRQWRRSWFRPDRGSCPSPRRRA